MDTDARPGQKGEEKNAHQLSVWPADKKQNLESVSEDNVESIIAIIKQAIAMGWDCPRAHILVKCVII